MRTVRRGWGMAGVACLALALAGGAAGAGPTPGGTLTVGLEPPTLAR